MEPQIPEYEVLGNRFTEAFYTTFDRNKEGILNMYHTNAMLTYEDTQAAGHAAIKEWLTNKLKFTVIQHQITKVDCQPVDNNGVLIFVTGRLQADGDPPHGFSEVFLIKPFNDAYYIFHDLFRLAIHNS